MLNILQENIVVIARLSAKLHAIEKQLRDSGMEIDDIIVNG